MNDESLFADIDVQENVLYGEYPEAFQTLLRDHTRFKSYREAHPELSEKDLEKDEHRFHPCNNIIWATDDYQERGEAYAFNAPITPDLITGEENGQVIRPRCRKAQTEQTQRVKDKAEVFTPSWVCNLQNNLVDEAWFGRPDVFNTTWIDAEGNHRWTPTPGPIFADDNPRWKKYVRDVRLEITCGEAPYLCSRYDSITGELIPLNHRIGLIDRKLRVVSEHCEESGEWLKMAQAAYQTTYGYEWQGDNLLLARESMLISFMEYYYMSFHKLPIAKSINRIAYIISWNLWQMDGLKMVIPGSCRKQVQNLMGEYEDVPCGACERGDQKGHIGTKCYIRNWSRPRSNPKRDFLFSAILAQ